MSREQPVVLVVDDNDVNIDLLVNILGEEYGVVGALNGPDALEIVSREPPDIILLDIMMPGMDGYEICTRLKSDERYRSIPVIFITAKIEVKDEEKGFACGAVDYITKPISPGRVRARVKTHLALYDQNRVLEEQVAERTRELTASKEKAEAANRAKSEFLANISHELRTPLNHLTGLSSLLLEPGDDPDTQEMHQIMHDSAEHLASLFNQLLDLSTLDAGNFELSPRPFDLRRSLTSKANIFKTHAQKKGLEFSFSMSDDVPGMVVGAQEELLQTLGNVLSNAIRYTDAGAISFGAALDAERFAGISADRVMLRFTVTDSGVGIAPHKLESIFGSFEIGEKFITKRLSGAGVGLAISKHLAEKMGGVIWAESTEGKGSSFFVSVPVRVVE